MVTPKYRKNMMFSHPFSRYGLALVLQKEELEDITNITTQMLQKHIEEGLSHFRMKTDNNPEIDGTLLFSYIDMQSIINNAIKGNPSNGIYLCPNIITSDIKAPNTWAASLGLMKKLKEDLDLLRQNEKITMGIMPIAGELNNGTKSKKNAESSVLEAACCSIATTTAIKPYLAYREKGGKYTPTAIIPDLEISEMKIFIQFYNLMLSTSVSQKELLKKEVNRKQGGKEKATYSRPPIYSGNFPYAPSNSAFGRVGLLGAIGKWAKEANHIEQGQKVLESLKDKPLYIIQYGRAQSVTINHCIIDLAKDNKLSDIVCAIQYSKIIHPFDENNPKGIESKKDVFNLFSSRFLELLNLSTFKDFLSVRAEYKSQLIELFNIFFTKQMNIREEVVQSVRALGLWLNYVAYRVGKQDAENQKKSDKYAADFKAKILVELESAVFGARKPAEVLNVIVRAGRMSGTDAPAESDVFLEAVLTGEISIDDAKSMLMAYARVRNKYEKGKQSTVNTETNAVEETEEFEDDSVSN
jgi:hypothetical protein